MYFFIHGNCRLLFVGKKLRIPLFFFFWLLKRHSSNSPPSPEVLAISLHFYGFHDFFFILHPWLPRFRRVPAILSRPSPVAAAADDGCGLGAEYHIFLEWFFKNTSISIFVWHLFNSIKLHMHAFITPCKRKLIPPVYICLSLNH